MYSALILTLQVVIGSVNHNEMYKWSLALQIRMVFVKS